jgi:hypothetical protein
MGLQPVASSCIACARGKVGARTPVKTTKKKISSTQVHARASGTTLAEAPYRTSVGTINGSKSKKTSSKETDEGMHGKTDAGASGATQANENIEKAAAFLTVASPSMQLPKSWSWRTCICRESAKAECYKASRGAEVCLTK